MEEDAVLRWLKRLVVALLAVFMGLSCVFMWRITRAVFRMEASVAHIVAEVAQVASASARLEQSVDEFSVKLAVKLAEFEGMAVEAFDSSSATAVLRGGSLLAGHEAPLAENASKEIEYLLACIGKPELQYEYEGKQRTAVWVCAKLYGKMRLQQAEIASAEDFIEKVAAKTTEGDPYYVIVPGGEKRALREWLIEALKQYRDTHISK